MVRIPGFGCLHDGVLEKDPMDDSYRFRVLDEKGDLVETVRLDDVLAEFLGKEVRLTIAFAAELNAAVLRSQPEGSQMTAISFDDLAKGD